MCCHWDSHRESPACKTGLLTTTPRPIAAQLKTCRDFGGIFSSFTGAFWFIHFGFGRNIKKIWFFSFSCRFPRSLQRLSALTPAHSNSLPHLLMHEYLRENNKSPTGVYLCLVMYYSEVYATLLLFQPLKLLHHHSKSLGRNESNESSL